MEKYFIGLDIGTDSLGWAVTDDKYNLCKANKHQMWGTRLFEESNTAEERRLFRSGRRRTERKKFRINLLQMLFNEEISKVDCSFFQRLSESNLYREDKSSNRPYSIFSDENFTDKDYFRKYPTIYHLRKDLISRNSIYDIRLLYIALHHIIKHRGHFLFDNFSCDSKDNTSTFETMYSELSNYLQEELHIEFSCGNKIKEFADTLTNTEKNIRDKKNSLYNIFDINKKEDSKKIAVINLLCGGTVALSDLFDNELLKQEEKNKISFSKNFDEEQISVQAVLKERFEVIEKIYTLYNWARLKNILRGEKYLSNAKVNIYDEHKSDLQALKKFVKEQCPEKYNKIFRNNKKGLKNYVAYSRNVSSCKNNVGLEESADQEDFCKFLEQELKNISKDGYEELFQKIANKTFMPKLKIKDNGTIPMQINEIELKAILDNATQYFDFLNNKDENGSISEKIVSIFEYRIPYYVGPLNDKSDKSWFVRNPEKKGKILPWNFNEMIDIDTSAEKFIENLTCKCTYLHDKDVIAKNSLLYSKYMVLNELNNLKINEKNIDVEEKKKIYNDLFLREKKISVKKLKDYLVSECGASKDITITGIDDGFKSSLKPYIDMKKFNLSNKEKESAIKTITIFGGDRKLLLKRLRLDFRDKLSEEEILQLSKLKYTAWAPFSKEFLTEIFDFDTKTGEVKKNIIDTLWDTNDNLMVLLGSKYNFSVGIENHNSKLLGNTNLKDAIDDLYVSPKVKRPIYQTLKVVNEIIKVKKLAPAKIFVEMTRYDGVKGDKGRKESRRNKLLALYNNCKTEYAELYDLLNTIYTEDSDFRSLKLFLWFTQCGKCMYTGEKIPIDDLFNKNLYDIDHIFPQSKVKDDSLDNRVLVKKEINAAKNNDYPLKDEIRGKMRNHWKFLLDKGFISKKKYDRLTRNTSLKDSELSDFISRQLVETSQSTKAVAELLKSYFKDEKTEIVYVKSRLVSDFRKDFNMWKCRDVSDLHHAKDAYLNIVVGNVYNEAYTHNKSNFIKKLQTKEKNNNISLNKMFTHKTENAWIVENNESLNIVKKTMNKNNILFTRYSCTHTGALFKQNPLRKGKGQVPQKKNSPISDISKYGGYDKPTARYFSYVLHEGKKGEHIKQLVAINNYQVNDYEANPIKFLTDVLNLKNPKILIKVVKYNSCIEIDGFRMHISNKSNDRITVIPGMQLVLGYEKEEYIRNLSKVVSRIDEYNKFKKVYKIIKDDNISSEENLKLYKALTDKMTKTIYKVLYKSLGTKLQKSENNFTDLSLEEQCIVLLEMLKILHCNTLTGDLRLVGESKQTGEKKINSVISKIKADSIKLINQSVSGLFENEVDLLNIGE